MTLDDMFKLKCCPTVYLVIALSSVYNKDFL